MKISFDPLSIQIRIIFSYDPHSIKRAAAPVTNGVAIDVPDKLFSPPPGAAAKIPTSIGATRSGFFTPYL